MENKQTKLNIYLQKNTFSHGTTKNPKTKEFQVIISVPIIITNTNNKGVISQMIPKHGVKRR